MMRETLAIARIAVLVAASAAAPASAGDWLTAESEHFIVRSDGPGRKVQDYLRKLEAFRYLSLLMLGADAAGAREQVKFDIHLLRDQADMQKVRPEFSKLVAGVYFHCAEGSGAYSTLQDRPRIDDIDPGQVVLFHEYAHHLMTQYAKAYYPQWYVEGFAEYMSTAYVEEDKISLGYPFPERSWLLRQGRWIGFDRVLKPGFKGRGDKADDEWEVLSFYAQSWILVHYMLGDSDRTQKFNAYFARIGAGEDPIAAFEPATGMAIDTLERRLKRYAENMPVVTVASKGMPKASIKTEVLPDNAKDYLLNASLLKTCLSKPQGETVLAQLRALKGAAGNPPPALRLAIDRAEILFGDVKAARDDLQAYVTADETSFDAHHLLGRAWMTVAQDLDGEGRAAAMAQARSQFLKAYRLKKLDAANLYHLAQAMAVDGVSASVVNAARGARALAPGVSDYAIYEAFIDIDANERDKAVQALMPLASNPHDPQQSARVRDAIEAIKAGKGKSDISRALNPAP